MKKHDVEAPLPEQYDRPVDLDLLSEAIVTSDSYHQPIYEGQIVHVVIGGSPYFAQATDTNAATYNTWAGFVVLSVGKLQGAVYTTRDVEWCERLSASDETIARLGGNGIK